MRLFIIMFLINISWLGLALCGSVRFFYYDNNKEMMDNSFWYVFTIVSLSIFTFVLFVLVPIEILILGRKERKGEKLKKLTLVDLLGLPFGFFNPEA
ncbi:MAG: hypothetical protein NTW55_03200, partial [Planctomycetota bacterium]|nr:hypothetical protein [Planctomycetota bacterium]